jgi:tetratricopeptide (TPR) repeat protein
VIRNAAETRLPPDRRSAALSCSWRRLLAGDIAEAERAANEALNLSSQSGEPDAFAFYAALMLQVRRAQGRLGEIIELLEQTVAEDPGITVFRAALAVALCEVDRIDDARVVFEPLVTSRFTAFPFDMIWLTAVAFCAETAAYLERRDAAALLAELLAPWRHQLVFNGITCDGSVARPLALAFATTGRLDEADDAFVQAAAIHKRIEAPIELARTQVNWARMLAMRARPGDPDRGRALLNPALTTASSLGLATIQRHAETLLAELAAK